MSNETLVLRIAAPMQSWGDISTFNTRGTAATPSYSGLLGLFRAAQGQGREDRGGLEELKRGLSMAVRVDRRGSIIRDFHTINPSRSTGKKNIPNGEGKEWTGGETLITNRYYIADGVFTALVNGEADLVRRLHKALLSPVWHLSLGRKSCPPDYPLVLGSSALSIEELLSVVPVVREGSAALPAEVHFLSKPSVQIPGVLVADEPKGPHVQDGYRPRTRWVTRDHFESPSIESKSALLTWAKENLTRREQSAC